MAMAADQIDTTVVFDKSGRILETILTFDWLEKTLQGCLKTSATFEDCKATRIGLGQGFLSFIIHIEPKWTQDSKQEEVLPTDLVLKVPTTTTYKNMDKMFDGAESSKELKAKKEMGEVINMDRFITMVHQCECEAYRLLEPYRKELRMPRCYYQEKISDERPGAIIMEYPAGDKGVAKKFYQPLDENSLLQVAEAFAVLHAWCYKNRSLWEGNPHLKVNYADVMQMTEEQCHADDGRTTIDIDTGNTTKPACHSVEPNDSPTAGETNWENWGVLQWNGAGHHYNDADAPMQSGHKYVICQIDYPAYQFDLVNEGSKLVFPHESSLVGVSLQNCTESCLNNAFCRAFSYSVILSDCWHHSASPSDPKAKVGIDENYDIYA